VASEQDKLPCSRCHGCHSLLNPDIKWVVGMPVGAFHSVPALFPVGLQVRVTAAGWSCMPVGQGLGGMSCSTAACTQLVCRSRWKTWPVRGESCGNMARILPI
jgi:hypothetical protein